MGHPSPQFSRPPFAKGAKDGAPKSTVLSPTLRKRREGWGTQVHSSLAQPSQKARRMGHPSAQFSRPPFAKSAKDKVPNPHRGNPARRWRLQSSELAAQFLRRFYYASVEGES